jgi:hypothetical protein
MSKIDMSNNSKQQWFSFPKEKGNTPLRSHSYRNLGNMAVGAEDKKSEKKAGSRSQKF